MTRGRVLIIDDDPAIIAGMAALLTDEGIETYTTSSPFEFPMLLRRHDPDLVLIDLQMPALRGEALLAVTHERALKRDARFVLFSGRGANELSELTERLGADGYVQKGADINQTLRRIRFWIRQRQTMRACRGTA